MICRGKINWVIWLIATVAGAGVIAFAANLFKRVRWEFSLEKRRRWLPLHLLDWRMKFYDTTLNPKVQYARHALAIDERRKAFNRVPWGAPSDRPERADGEPEWLQQVWFAGCHSDIGGSYPEEESRLSDIALKWILDVAIGVGLKFDASVLKLYPDPSGPQHDETRHFPFKYLPQIDRSIPVDAPLHETVKQRLLSSEVLQYDLYRPYRPKSLCEHRLAKEHYGGFSKVD